MKKVLRASVVVTSAFLAVPFWGVPAAVADDSVLSPSAGGYFNSDGIRKPDQSPAMPPNVTSDRADGVAPGHLAVAARAGMENKVSFLLFDLLEVDPGATITKAVVTLPTAPNGGDNVNLSPAPEKVIACPAGEGGFFGDDGTALQDAPERKCAAAASKGVATADGSAYAFDITKIAAGWLEMNDGLALTSDPAARSSAFQVVFKPAEEAKLALTFTAPDGGETDLELPVVPDAGTSTSTGSTDLGTSFDSGSFSAPVDSGAGLASEPLISADVPVAAPQPGAPAEAPVAAPNVATVPVANTMQSSLTPTTSFWVGLLMLGGLLALLSLILGDPRVARASTSQSRLTQALQARERSAGRPGTTRPALSL